MKHPIYTVEDLGLIIRAVRKTSHVRLDDLAATVKVSKQFTADAENGKSTIQMGKVLLLLQELGIALSVDIPESVSPALQRLRAARGLQ
jgi:transcriptional regulator with XRE-family HTH domain